MLNAVKMYLKITWDDEDSEIQSIIERGKAELNDMAGVELDFDSPGLARSLLLDYCRYVHNQAKEYFRENFSEEISYLQWRMGVQALGSDEATG